MTETDPDSNVTTTAYNADSLVTSVTDADSNTTSYAYDHDGRETSETDANSNTASATYNADGLVTSQTDKDGRVTDFSYDNDGRMVQEQWMSGGTAIYTASYGYDPAGDLTSASDNNSAYAYTYNADNSVTQIDNSGTPTGPHVVLNIGYDNMQRETSLSATVTSTLDFLNHYSYNADSAITQITQQGQTGGNTVAAKLVNFAFDNDGRLTTISRYANLAATELVATSTYGYDGDSDITSLAQAKGGTSLNSSTYSYDHDGRVTGDSTVDGTDSFSYDAASQLTAATHSYETNETYSFDSTGNRTNTGYSTGTNNQLSSDGTYNYLYDANGNMTKQTTIATGAYVTYAWDYHNRLTDVESYNSSNVLQSHVHYIYNVFDQLIERQVDPTGGGTYTTTQAFVYDPSGNIVLVYNGSGALTDRMLNGPGANNALADENGSGTVSWLLADNEGTIRDVVQYNSGTNTTTVVDHLEYNSFGVITAQSNSADQPLFAYTGQMWDAAAGLYYYHARWYDASTGRFISQDPTSFAAGDPNLYRYVGNSPTNLIDATGTDSTDSAATAKQMADATRGMQLQMQAFDYGPPIGTQYAPPAVSNLGGNMTLTGMDEEPPTDGSDVNFGMGDPPKTPAPSLDDLLAGKVTLKDFVTQLGAQLKQAQDAQQWWKDSILNKPIVGADGTGNQPDPNPTPKDKGEQYPIPGGSEEGPEVEMGPVRFPKGPMPEFEIKVFNDPPKWTPFKMKWFYGADWDQRMTPGGGIIGGSFRF